MKIAGTYLKADGAIKGLVNQVATMEIGAAQKAQRAVVKVGRFWPSIFVMNWYGIGYFIFGPFAEIVVKKQVY